MKIREGYSFATKKYGIGLADNMKQDGIPKWFIDTACRFHNEYGVPIEQLQDDWRQWNRYVLNNPSYDGVKDLNKLKTYLEFKKVIAAAQKPYICPNPIYDDGNLSIGELKTQKDARWFPIQNLAFPDASNDFCIYKKLGGWKQFQKYKKNGRRLFIIYDKQRSVNDRYKRILMMSNDGELYFWDHYDRPCGTTKDKNSAIMQYVDSLPYQAQIAISEIKEDLNESKTTKYMKQNKKTINEAQLRAIVKEAVKNALLNEEIDTGQIPSYQDRMEHNRYRREIDELPEIKELRRKIHKLRVEMDDYEQRGGDMEAYYNELHAAKNELENLLNRHGY